MRRFRACIEARGSTRVGFELFLVVQLLHLGEHVVQMVQLTVLGWAAADARGLVSRLDVETVHFAWNLVVVVALGWLLRRGVRSSWLIATVIWAVLHTSEHAYLLVRALVSGLENQPGILGARGLLATWGWSVPGLTTWSRPMVHFIWNVGEVIWLTLAYLAYVGPGVSRSGARRLVPTAVVILLALVATPDRGAVQPGPQRYVSATDPACAGRAPCYVTIQRAVDAALPGETVVIQAGTYREHIRIHRKNIGTPTDEIDRLIIEADPEAPLGSVVLAGGGTECDDGPAVLVHRSRFITVRGLAITGFGAQAVQLQGANNDNHAIHLERLRIFGNGSPECDGGITIGPGNSSTLIAHNVIYGNARRGIVLLGGSEGPHYIVNNTIHANSWSGVTIGRIAEVFLVNNAITGNGTGAGRTGGRFGVEWEPATTRHRGRVHLLHNLICGNRKGEIEPPPVDASASGNLTPSGTEGPGVTASPGCEIPARIYADVAGRDARPTTKDDDFGLLATSPAIDRGMDPRTIGLSVLFNPVFEADFRTTGTRPRPGSANAPALFDIGAFEFVAPDRRPPVITFLQPAAGAFIRHSISVRVHATDDTAVADIALMADAQRLGATLVPTPPASALTASATLNTLSLMDGTHTLTATATDKAGNRESVARVVIVDNTPPETMVATGPAGDIAESTATFTFTGTDNLTPPANLLFAWRVDDGPFTEFSRVTTTTIAALAEGAHTFEVRARDVAGNEDPTPASRRFVVALGPAITQLDPSSGAVGTLVTVTGARFTTPVQVAFNGVPARLRTVAETTVTTTVPFGAETGALSVITSRGTAAAPFVVSRSTDFALRILPAEAPTLAGGAVSYAITPTAVDGFTGLVGLSVSGLSADVRAVLTPNTLAPGQMGTLTLQTSATSASTIQPITLTGTAVIDGVTVSRQQTVALRVLAGGITALAGRALDTDANPVQGVTFILGGKSAQTDAGGNFLVAGVAAGPDQFLFIDGSTAVPDRKFPTFPVLVTLEANKVNTLSFTPYLHSQKSSNFTTIVPGQETVVVDRDIPGFEMRIPADVTIIGWDGRPNTRVSVRTVPLDRMPLPHPDPPITARSVYMLYFDKVGGGTPTRPVPVTALNDLELEPGASAELWYYDEGPTPGSATFRWQKAGTATVSADGRTITTDPGVGLPRFCCGAFCFASVTRPAAGVSLKRRGARGAEPVDLATGLFVLESRDMAMTGRVPLAVTRTYRNADSTLGPFGVGSSAFFTESLRQPTPQSMILIEPGNTRTTFTQQADGSFTNDTEPSLRGARVSVNGDGTATLRFRDGVTHLFEPTGGDSFQLRAIADRNGNSITIARDGFGRPVSLIESGGRRLDLTFNVPFVQVIAVRDPLGREVRYTYGTGARLSSVTDAAGGVTSYTYDGSGNLLTITDARGSTTLANEYSASGRVVKQTQGDGGEWTFAYMLSGARVTGPGCPGATCPEVESSDAIARGYSFSGGFVVATTVTDPRGSPMTYRFNSFGEVIEEIDALGQHTRFERAEGTNLLLSTTDALGRHTRYEYDVAGNVIRIVDAAGHSRTFVYEPSFNQPLSVTDELGQVTSFEYDRAGNLVGTIDPLAGRTVLSHDALGQLTAVTDAVSNTHRFSYDAVGKRTIVADPIGHATRREFDGAGRLVARIDALGARTSFAYDALDRLVSITDAGGGVTRFSHDANGNLIRIVDARGNSTIHTYDPMNRLTIRTDPAGLSATFTYDGLGNVLAVTDRNGHTTRHRYDPLNRRVRTDYADGSTEDLRYDAVGRLISIVDSLGGAIARRYDVMDRLLTETTAHGTVTSRYDAVGRPVEMTSPGQASVTYQWDAAGRLTGLAREAHTIRLQYDTAARRTALTLPNGIATEYEYDAASRVAVLRYRSPQAVLGEIVNEYDVIGRRVAEGGRFARTLIPDAVTHATYGPANRQLSFGEAAMTYDNNGNLTSLSDGHGTTRLDWDARNRLVTVTGPTSTHSFVYDAFGRRIRRLSDGVAVDYVYDGDDVVQEIRDNGVVSYLRAPWTDEPFMRSSGEFYLFGPPGSVIGLADDRGAVTTSYTYETFGSAQTSGTATTNPFGYAGREDDGSGLYGHRGRYYSATLRRFVGEDPAGFASGDPNLYAYVHNNPLTFFDSSGRDATIWVPAGPGRTWKDGPRNGNWGGARWSGGQGPPFSGKILPPVDSGDECYMHHDLCWDECAKCPATELRCQMPCNRTLVRCLENLADDPRQWARPPRRGTENDSRLFRRMAIESFRTPRDDVFQHIHPLIP